MIKGSVSVLRAIPAPYYKQSGLCLDLSHLNLKNADLAAFLATKHIAPKTMIVDLRNNKQLTDDVITELLSHLPQSIRCVRADDTGFTRSGIHRISTFLVNQKKARMGNPRQEPDNILELHSPPPNEPPRKRAWRLETLHWMKLSIDQWISLPI